MLNKRIVALLICCCVSLAASASAQVREFKRLTSQEYQKAFTDLVPQGYVPVQIKVAVRNNQDLYDLRLVKSTQQIAWASHHRMTDQSFEEKKKQYVARNLKTSFQQSYTIDNTRYHVAIWREAPAQPPVEWSNISQIPVTGRASRQLLPFDQLMKQFLFENQLPGATLAVSRKGRLLYAKGFGYSDVERKSAMQSESLLRIASISKPFTAVAILQLIEQGKLKLDDKVFEILPHKPNRMGGKHDPRLLDVTVLHCLQHTAGWDRKVSFDPMFRPKTISKTLKVPCPPGSDNIIRYMLNQPLDHSPGTKYAYSNFGYCVLGRVIEQTSGVTYEAYVKANILKPLQINGMSIGSTLLDGRKKTESRYYVKNNSKRPAVVGNLQELVPLPYGTWHLEAMDSHGGWIASAADLVKFASAFDQPRNSPLLSANSIGLMFSRPTEVAGRDQNGKPPSSYYGLGWSVRPVGSRANTWHAGSLDGTSTILVRRHDGLNWAVLFNQRNCADGKAASSKIDSLLHQAANAVQNWPDN